MSINLSVLGTYETEIFDESAAEIAAYDAGSQRLFVVNGNDDAIDVLDLSDPSTPTLLFSIMVDDDLIGGFEPGGINSVAVSGGLVAIAVEADGDTDPGQVTFFNVNGDFLNAVEVGVLPDAVTFTPDGSKLLSANEAEPGDDADPVGSISIVDLSNGVQNATVTTAGLEGFDAAALKAEGVRIFPNKTAAEDLEPEFITVSEDSRTAYVSLQENNAIAVVDIASGIVTDILPLGLKDYSQTGNGLDPSDRDDGINIAPQPVFGLYQPDAVATYTVNGQTYLVTANEGDARNEDERIKDIALDPVAFPNADDLQEDENLGRLDISTIDGDTDGDGDFDQLVSYGSRSFSIFDTDGNLVFDSGDAFEQITAAEFPDFFNSDNDENTFDTRSDAKGPEPEGVVLGEVNGQTYAFVGLERGGGVMVYDITDPGKSEFVQYINNRDFSGDPEAGTAGDLGPEGLVFISAEASPEGIPLLVVTNEVSGSTTVYDVDIQVPGDAIMGTDGRDNLNGTGRDEFFVAGAGNDNINTNGGNDTVLGGAGNDNINGTSGDDYLRGDEGNDRINGNGGNDTLIGGAGNDQINGSGSDELILGGSGNDRINGNGGDDTLIGGAGNDVINTGSGDDLINGGLGSDTIQLNGGNDVVVLDQGEGVDVVRNFRLGQTQFDVNDFEALSFARAGNGVRISQGGDVLAVVRNVQVSTFEQQADSIFV